MNRGQKFTLFLGILFIVLLFAAWYCLVMGLAQEMLGY